MTCVNDGICPAIILWEQNLRLFNNCLCVTVCVQEVCLGSIITLWNFHMSGFLTATFEELLSF